MNRLLLAAAVLSLTCWAAAANADSVELPRELDLGAVIKLARSAQNPRVQAIRAAARTARAELAEASVHPNPSLSYALTGPLRGPNTVDGTQHFIGADQPLLLAGQRGARRRAAERRIRAAGAGADADLFALVREARHLYVDLVLAEEAVRIHEQSLHALSRVRSIVETRATLGGSSRYDALRLEVEQTLLSAALDGTRTELADAGRRLGVLLGYPGWSPRARGQLEPLGVAPPVAAATRAAQMSNPELRAAIEQALAASSEIDAADRDAWPVPSVSVGALLTTEPRSLAGVAGITIPLPLFDRAQGTRARARAQAVAAAANQRAIRAQVLAEAERAALQLAEKRASLERLERGALERLPVLEAMAEDAYREGASNVVALLDASNARRDLLLARATLVAEVMHAEVDVLAVTGAILDVPQRPR